MKRFLATISIFLLCTLFAPVAFAEEIKMEEMPTSTSEEAMPFAEQREWYYRINNGYIEKRLWSHTYGKWLTDWIIVGPAP